MKKNPIGILIFLSLLSLQTNAQHLGEYKLIIAEESFNDLKGVQSYVTATHQGKWLIIGGRTDGLHRRQPWATFWEDDNNKTIYVIDPETKQVWSASLNVLDQPLFEQLQSTNMEFEQVGDKLYVIGGYGFSQTEQEHITYPHLVSVDVPGLIDAVISEGDITPYFRYIEDVRMQVTGGYLSYLDAEFFLTGGQKFIGRYNPMGPDHGPGFIQTYTNAVRRFRIKDDDAGLFIIDFKETIDEDALHRRDLNVLPQIFPDGGRGFTAFSGVFQHDVDLPWLDVVDIRPDGYSRRTDFQQYLNQYHSAHAGLYDNDEGIMYSIFFGGIAQYYYDEFGYLMRDDQVPFVNTISLVTRFADNSLEEQKIGEMPGLFGASAEFIVDHDIPADEQGIILLNEIESDTTLIGYIYGGIESSAPNIFFINTGEQSNAAARMFKVYLIKTQATSIREHSDSFDLHVFPNPVAKGWIIANFTLREKEDISFRLLNLNGQLVDVLRTETLPAGDFSFQLDLGQYNPATFLLEMQVGNKITAKKVVLN